MATPNITLNFLVGVEGVKYTNIVEGATNTIEFLRFFEEAASATDPLTGRPVHHGKAENALNNFFDDMSNELLYLSIYSPDLSPVEEAFSVKMKYLLNIATENLCIKI